MSAVGVNCPDEVNSRSQCIPCGLVCHVYVLTNTDLADAAGLYVVNSAERTTAEPIGLDRTH
jgi:hypothetical protein